MGEYGSAPAERRLWLEVDHSAAERYRHGRRTVVDLQLLEDVEDVHLTIPSVP